MLRFSFRLESVRRLREHAETQAKERLAAELAASEARARDLRQAEDALQAAVSADAFAAGPVRAEDLASREAFLERRRKEREEAARLRQVQEERVAAEARSLEEAARERAVIERLKHRQLAGYAQEERRGRERDLLEGTLLRYRRASGGSR